MALSDTTSSARSRAFVTQFWTFGVPGLFRRVLIGLESGAHALSAKLRASEIGRRRRGVRSCDQHSFCVGDVRGAGERYCERIKKLIGTQELFFEQNHNNTHVGLLDAHDIVAEYFAERQALGARPESTQGRATV